MDAAVTRHYSPKEAARQREEGRVEDLEFLLHDMHKTLSALESKRDRLQHQITAAALASRRARKSAAADDDEGTCSRSGGGSARKRRLVSAAGGVKRERKRLEAMRGKLEAKLVDAIQRLALLGNV